MTTGPSPGSNSSYYHVRQLPGWSGILFNGRGYLFGAADRNREVIVDSMIVCRPAHHIPLVRGRVALVCSGCLGWSTKLVLLNIEFCTTFRFQNILIFLVFSLIFLLRQVLAEERFE